MAEPVARKWHVCAAADIKDGEKGVRFQAEWSGIPAPGFVVRWNGHVYAYLNECQHIPIELDYNEGDFWDLSRQYLICATHGAYYKPDTGLCLGGPCRGRRLAKLHVVEEEGEIYFLPDGFLPRPVITVKPMR